MTSSRAGISSRIVTCFAVVVAGAVTGSVAGANPGGGPSQKVLAIGVSLATTKPGASEVARRAAVTQWIELELDAIATHRTNPPRASRALALVSRAMYEAAVAGEASRDAAVAEPPRPSSPSSSPTKAAASTASPNAQQKPPGRLRPRAMASPLEGGSGRR